MNRVGLRKIVAVILVGGMCFTGQANAGPADRRHKKPYPKQGRMVHAMPAGHIRVAVGPKHYYYHAGVFYRKGPKGYAVVLAPRGAVVMHLPAGFRSRIVAGVTYYVFAGVYYRKAVSGHRSDSWHLTVRDRQCA